MTATLEDVTAVVVRSGDIHAIGGLRWLVDQVGPTTAHRLLTADLPAEDAPPGPARLTIRLYDRLVERGPLIGTLGELAAPLAATRAQLADALDILVAHGQADVAVDGLEVTVTLSEGRHG